jgi:hypothetical protein
MGAALIFILIMIVILFALPLAGPAAILLLAVWLAVVLGAAEIMRKRRKRGRRPLQDLLEKVRDS